MADFFDDFAPVESAPAPTGGEKNDPAADFLAAEQSDLAQIEQNVYDEVPQTQGTLVTTLNTVWPDFFFEWTWTFSTRTKHPWIIAPWEGPEKYEILELKNSLGLSAVFHYFCRRFTAND